MNVKKPSQFSAKHPNFLANHVGYKKYRISSGLGHAPNHRVSSLHSDVSQRLHTQVRIGVPKSLRENMVQALSHCAALYKCAWTFGSGNKQMEQR